LRDKFIWGVKDSNIKKKLLSEGTITFKKCVELGLTMESANNEVTKLDQHHEINYHKQLKSKKYQHNIGNKVAFSLKNYGKATTPNDNGKKDMVCYCCGIKRHTKPSCKYKTYSCSNCSKIGQLKKCVKAKIKKVHNLEQCNDDFNLKKVISSNNDNNSIDTAVLKFIISFNSTKHYSTGFSPVQLYIQRSLFTSYDRLTPFA